MYCSRCNGLLLEGFLQIVTYGKSLQQEGAVVHFPCSRAGGLKNQNNSGSSICNVVQDEIQDPSVHPWGGLTTTREGALTLLDCYLYSKSLKGLQIATKNFRQENLIGEGGFGFLYKGWIDENTYAPTRPGTGVVVAIKNLKPESFQGHREWLAEVNYLSQLHHENLVKLIGYCSDGKNRLLVYEFMHKGSLENHLFRKGVQPIPWTIRINIAVAVARGLTFLHTLDRNVIYRDLKAANILLIRYLTLKVWLVNL
ncbi:hypothetical protein LR48_Vigan05g090900 [Vigna angularis]|uniref:non-specific serine/threonine protein kinase n=1 Tax=Phaseolus angularis TaxID=3914 RepID=A0A0L9UK78_PHAAN|nr:hypothetical protein LR48_Vigan05g090900 [Vigna angularis]